jgi:hypothetical protein
VLGRRRLREVTYLLTLKAHLRFTPGERESFRQATLNGTLVWVQVQPGAADVTASDAERVIADPSRGETSIVR